MVPSNASRYSSLQEALRQVKNRHTQEVVSKVCSALSLDLRPSIPLWELGNPVSWLLPSQGGSGAGAGATEPPQSFSTVFTCPFLYINFLLDCS